MNELSTIDNSSGLSVFFHNENGKMSIPKPFERDIFLFDTHVAGTTHVEGIDELEPHLKIGDKLDFFREPENEYDPKAIVIKTDNGVKVGYVPEFDNAVFARLMDAGKLLFARIDSKEWIENWLKIRIKLFLRD